MADVKSQKKKAWFGLSTGFIDNRGCIEKKVGTGWNPGKDKFKKRSGKGHNNYRTWGRK